METSSPASDQQQTPAPGKKNQVSAKGCGCLIALVIILGMIFWMTCGGSKKPVAIKGNTPAERSESRHQAWEAVAKSAFQDNFQKVSWAASPAATGGEYEEGNHEVEFKVGTTWSEAMVFSLAGSRISSFLKEAHGNDLLKSAKGVVFRVSTDLTDQHGNKSVDTLLIFRFKGSDLQQVNWENITEFQLLDLASDVAPVGRAGWDVASAYAGKESNKKLTPAICSKLAR